jgi:hypothetical protein
MRRGCWLGLNHRRGRRIPGHFAVGSSRREQLKGLTQIEFAVLGIRVKRIEFLDRLVRSEFVGGKLSRELADNLVRSSPVKKITRYTEAVELADTNLHRVAISVDISGLGSAVQLIPEYPVVIKTGCRKPHPTTNHEAYHHTGNELFHLWDAPLQGCIET